MTADIHLIGINQHNTHFEPLRYWKCSSGIVKGGEGKGQQIINSREFLPDNFVRVHSVGI